jgi:hypothetical protein
MNYREKDSQPSQRLREKRAARSKSAKTARHFGALLEMTARVDAMTDQNVTLERVQLAELRAALEELRRCCAAIPECDATAKLRGKVGRLESSLREAEQTGNFTPFKTDAKATQEMVKRIHDADPLTQFLQCMVVLNERVDGAAGG